MSILLNDALENELISLNMYRNIPKKCKCNSDIVLSNSLNRAYCKSEACVYSVVSRVIKLFNKLNIDIDDNEIRDIVIKLNISTPYQIFMFNEAFENKVILKTDVSNIDIISEKISEIRNKPLFLYEIVEMSCINSIELVAKTIFDGFLSFDEAYNEIEHGQVSFINERLGISTQEGTVLALEIYNIIMNLRDELYFAETQLSTKNNADYRINIAFCDNIIPFVNRGEYLEYINSVSKYTFNYVSSISDNTDVLIRNADDIGSKNRLAKMINNKYVGDKINNGELELKDINKKVHGSLKPLGCKIYICKSEELIDRLKDINGEDNGEQSV